MRNSQAQAYRESEVLSASPGRLLVITFDGLLTAMTRYRVALSVKNYELASAALATSRAALCELIVTLNRDAGGDLASRLAAVYAFVLGELDAISLNPDVPRLDRNIALIRELREAFAQAAATTGGLVS